MSEKQRREILLHKMLFLASRNLPMPVIVFKTKSQAKRFNKDLRALAKKHFPKKEATDATD